MKDWEYLEALAAAHGESPVPEIRAHTDRLRKIATELRRLRAVPAGMAAAREELAAVLADWNAVVDASGSKTNGGLAGHVAALRADAERWRKLVEDNANARDGTYCLFYDVNGNLIHVEPGNENTAIDTAMRAKGEG